MLAINDITISYTNTNGQLNSSYTLYFSRQMIVVITTPATPSEQQQQQQPGQIVVLSIKNRMCKRVCIHSRSLLEME